MSTTPRVKTTALTHNEAYCTKATYLPLTGYEPKILETSTAQRLLQRSSRMNLATQIRSLRTCVMPNSTVRRLEKRYLHHCSSRSEKNQRTEDKAYHSHEESLLSAQSLIAPARTERLVHELIPCQKRKSSRDSENERIRIILERQKEQILAEERTEFRNTNFKPILIEEALRN